MFSRKRIPNIFLHVEILVLMTVQNTKSVLAYHSTCLSASYFAGFIVCVPELQKVKAFARCAVLPSFCADVGSYLVKKILTHLGVFTILSVISSPTS